MAGKKDFAQGEQAAIARDVSQQGEWIPMIDWSSTFPGNRGVNRHDKYELHDVPIGVRLSVEEAKKHGPILTSNDQWEGAGALQVKKTWKRDGKYHMLYVGYPDKSLSKNPGLGDTSFMCYATSDDGYNWKRTNLGQVEWKGSKNNNIIANAPVDTPFEDPKAPPEERFKAIGQVGGTFDPDTGKKLDTDEAYKRWKQQEQLGDKYTGPRMESRHWVEGWTSPDAIHWKKIGKVGDFGSDGGNAAQYDAETDSYYAYIRVGGTGRRATGLSKTKNFWKWPPANLVLFPDPQDDPDVSFYSSSYFKYPTDPNLHCAFVGIYHQLGDFLDAQIAFSRNKTHWFRPERKAIIPIGEIGGTDTGGIGPWGGLIELPDGKWATVYYGFYCLHNWLPSGKTEPTIKKHPGTLNLAIWDPHRFCSVEAQGEGRFTIPTVQPTKKELRLNFRCNTGGFIKVELIAGIPSRIHPDAKAIPGFSFEESEILTGDHLNKTVSWNGNSDISKLIQKKSEEGILGFGENGLAIRIQMFQAKLFAYSI